LSPKPDNWDLFFALLKEAEIPADFMSSETREQGKQERALFEDWVESIAR